MEAERRQITVLFTDMVGFTTFSERAGEEAAFALMGSVYPLMDDAVREQGGVIQAHTGDGIMAVFGAPVAFEDAPLRACRAALSILERLRTAGSHLEARYGIRPQFRIGLNTGLAVVGRQGGADAALGDTVNVASRLQALAAPDSVCMSELMCRLLQGMVEGPVREDTRRSGREPRWQAGVNFALRIALLWDGSPGNPSGQGLLRQGCGAGLDQLGRELMNTPVDGLPESALEP